MIVAAELALAGWLASGRYRAAAWAVVVTTFVGFAAFNASSALLGVASCGCFGEIKVNPWAALIVDAVVLAGLMFCIPGRSAVRQEVGELFPGLVRVGVGAGIAFMILAAGVVAAFGSSDAALAALRSESVSVTAAVEFPAGPGGEFGRDR